MNYLREYDTTGRLLREVGLPASVATIPWQSEHWFTIVPPAGYQLNGHRWDCRCATCRPDLQT